MAMFGSRSTHGVLLVVIASCLLASSGSTDDAQELLGDLKNARKKSVVIVLDNSASMLNVPKGNGATIMQLGAQVAEEIVETLEPGDQFTLITFDNEPEVRVRHRTISGPSDLRYARDQITRSYESRNGTVDVPHPDRKGTNIRWAHHRGLKAALSASTPRFCILITDGADQPPPARDSGYRTYTRYYDVRSRGSQGYPNTPEAAEYRELLGQARDTVSFYGIGVRIMADGTHKADPKGWDGPNARTPTVHVGLPTTNGTGQNATGNVPDGNPPINAPAGPGDPNPQPSGMPPWLKWLLGAASLLLLVLFGRSGLGRRFVELQKEKGHGVGDGQAFPRQYVLKPWSRKEGSIQITGGMTSATGFEYSLDGLTHPVARIEARPFGRFVIVPVSGGANGGQPPQVTVNGQTLTNRPAPLPSHSRIQVVAPSSGPGPAKGREHHVRFAVADGKR